jgi:spermidine synthase
VKLLNADGILATQNGVPYSNGEIIPECYNALTPNFKSVRFYVAPVPTYIGGFMAFSFATNEPANANRTTKELQGRLEQLSGTMRYYNPEIHNAAFALPQYIRDLIPATK